VERQLSEEAERIKAEVERDAEELRQALTITKAHQAKNIDTFANTLRTSLSHMQTAISRCKVWYQLLCFCITLLQYTSWILSPWNSVSRGWQSACKSGRPREEERLKSESQGGTVRLHSGFWGWNWCCANAIFAVFPPRQQRTYPLRTARE